MKTKYNGILTLLLVLLVQITFAQEKTVTGKVSDASGPLPGVTVLIKGTKTGTQTDFDGNYSIRANTGAVLQFSFVGMQTDERTVGAPSVINVSMQESAEALEEVIVTAQGIARQEKSLGYAVSKIATEEVESKSQGDLGRVLTGKAAGVNITSTNGISGSGTSIIIRGYSSISGSNQPLFIVDGVPFDGGANEQDAFFDNVTESSRFLDLDPNNIEDIKVLKGLSATVLYGEEGRNGVILITTKNGSSGSVSKKMEITAVQSYFISEAVLPDYQKEYGFGFHQNLGLFFSNWGPSFDRDISSNSLYRETINGVNYIAHPFSNLSNSSLRNAFPEIAASNYAYKNYNSVEDFFRTGSVASTSINVRGMSDDGDVSYNLNFGNLDDEGFTPGNSLHRVNLGIGGSAKLNNKFTVSGTLNYTSTEYKTPPIAASAGSGTIGDGASIFGDVLYTPKSVDLFGMPFQTPDGRSIYYRSGNDIQNPLWTVANSKVTQETERIYGSANISYEINKNYSFKYQAGIDTYTEFNTYGQQKGGVDGDPTGIFRTITARNKIWNHSLQFVGDNELNDDLNLAFVLGAQSRRDEYIQDGVQSTNQLAFGVLEHFNFVNHTTDGLGSKSEKNTVGLYFDTTLGYKNYLYFNASARNDWSSTLETENNSIFYPGTSISFVPTSAFENLRTTNGLNYLKLRLGYGESAGFPSPYGTRNTLALSSRRFVDNQGNVLSSNAVSDRLGNPNLKPERIKELEIGLDAKFLNNRIGLNMSLFKKNSEDLITDQNLDPSTGFTISRVNAGELETKGVEIDLTVTPIKTKDFNWTVAGNFYADESEILSLPEGTDQIVLTSSIGGRPANYAIVGQPYGIMQGNTIVRDDQGNKVVEATGFYKISNDISIIGDPNPDWTGSLTNTINYKAFTLNVSMQYRHGGDIFSQTAATLIGRGVVDVGRDRLATYVLPGVLEDGSPNNIQITATNVGFDVQGFGANELQMFDGTTLRLSEVSLGYNLPSKHLDKTPFGSLSITLSGSNLWYKAFNFPDEVNFDTNTLSTGVGNGQGIDYITGPSSRRYGVSVKATF